MARTRVQAARAFSFCRGRGRITDGRGSKLFPGYEWHGIATRGVQVEQVGAKPLRLGGCSGGCCLGHFTKRVATSDLRKPGWTRFARSGSIVRGGLPSNSDGFGGSKGVVVSIFKLQKSMVIMWPEPDGRITPNART